MATELPSCEDFVIATIRQVRVHRPKIKEGAKAGVSVPRVLKVAREFYTSKQLTRAFASLLKKKKIVIVSEWREYSRAQDEHSHSYRRAGTIFLDKIRPFADELHRHSEQNHWKVDDRLEDLDASKPDPKTYRELRYGTVHVVEDGLSGGAAKPKGADLAHKIMQTFKGK